LETGFLAIFLGPASVAPPVTLLYLVRWLVFRVEFGAGLIKLRGDECWRDLTCLYYHHETQPMPNPLSWYFHHLPKPLHKAEVLGNHFAQLVAPWFLFFPQHIPSVAALLIILSYRPARTLVSRHQLMNYSFDPLHLVNTYGAFGSVTKTRDEVVIEGTEEPVLTPATRWREYEFKGKPGDVTRRPPQVAPYHLRLDWLMWFAAFSSPTYHEWFVPLLAKLLEGDRTTLGLLRTNPFPDRKS